MNCKFRRLSCGAGAILFCTLLGCGSSSKIQNGADVTVAYSVPRSDLIAAYLKAFDELDRVSWELHGDSLILGASTDSGFPAEVEVHFADEDSLVVVDAGFSYQIIDRFDHFPVQLEKSVERSLPAGSAMLRPEVVYPTDSIRCAVSLPPPGSVVVPPELIGGAPALSRQLYYPSVVKKSGIEGIIYAGFVVTEKGRVACVEIISGLTAGLNSQVIGAILASSYRAGTINGVPTPMRAELPLTFRSKEK